MMSEAIIGGDHWMGEWKRMLCGLISFSDMYSRFRMGNSENNGAMRWFVIGCVCEVESLYYGPTMVFFVHRISPVAHNL
ncbi:hypothetical protein CY34DRAFT_331694 [Suillus luteus UH-Slu-Lm8-n1]|uniref:Uncharacterized protein n=1 Tax=Suillus luteus UH-Slu-Lm8-n1 TaxID=930992 RepID=A0A0D0BB98_9AGAM|nr:hypothetical protein CY34DRAFT_331694 [Suillus luteus UH-Slu-Lm8-n1]